MKIILAALMWLCSCLSFGQLPQVYLSTEKSKALGALAKSATLVVVIENEKNADDAALIAAVKEQWKVGPVKYMSGLEFSEKFKSQSLETTNLYLFNNYTRELKYTGGVVVTMNPSKMLSVPAIYQGFYLTNAPNLLINALKNEKAPPYLHFSADALYDRKGIPNKGFYSLMIKNFNHDILYCQDDNNFVKKKKKKRKNGIYFFTADSLNNKVVLLVKEQTERQEKKAKNGETRKSQASEGKQGFTTDKYLTAKKTVVVFPEDVEYAVKKNDRDIILYNGGCLYSASDGSAYATVRGKTGGSNIFGYASFLISIGAIVYFLMAIQH